MNKYRVTQILLPNGRINGQPANMMLPLPVSHVANQLSSKKHNG